MAIGYNKYYLNSNVSEENYKKIIDDLQADINAEIQWIQKLEKAKDAYPAGSYQDRNNKADLQRAKDRLRDLEKQKRDAESSYKKITK